MSPIRSRRTGPGRRRPALGAASALLALGLGAAADAAPMFRGDPAHAGHFDGAPPKRFHAVKWTFPTGDRIVSSPVWADGVLYFGSDDGNVYAVDARDGRQRWKRVTGGPVPATPAVSGGRVFVGSYDGRFYALDAGTGNTAWIFSTGGERRFEGKGLHGIQPPGQTIADPYDVFLSSPAVVDGMVIFGSGDGNVYALDTATGALRWKFATGDVVHASPAVADGVVFVGSWDSRFYAIDAASGREKWRFQAGEDPVIHNQVGFQSSAAVVDGVVYVGCRDAHLYALDAASGREKWNYPTDGSWVVVSPAVSGGRVIFGTSDSSLFLELDAADGRVAQRRQGKAWMFSSPSVAGGVALYGLMNGTLEARDVASGELLWDYRTEASRRNAGWVLTSDGHINSPLHFGSNWREAPLAATVRLFGIGSVLSSPLVVGATVYFGSTDGNLYAIE